VSYIKFEHRHLGDELWLDATPAAFTVHAWALDHCNEQRTDGSISLKFAHRLNCPVQPVDLPQAWDNLVQLGWWEFDGQAYKCVGFLAHGLAADEQKRTTEKWAADKRRRRLHSNGNHEACTPNSKCPAVSTSGQGYPQSTNGQHPNPPVDNTDVHHWTSGRLDPTRLDSTRPDQTPKGSGKGKGTQHNAAAKTTTPLCADCGIGQGHHANDCEAVA
jgi:hypothetical protein